MVTRIQEWQNPINLTWINAISNLLRLDAVCNWKFHYSTFLHVISYQQEISKEQILYFELQQCVYCIINNSFLTCLLWGTSGPKSPVVHKGLCSCSFSQGATTEPKEKPGFHLWLLCWAAPPVLLVHPFSYFSLCWRITPLCFLGGRGVISPLVK